MLDCQLALLRKKLEQAELPSKKIQKLEEYGIIIRYMAEYDFFLHKSKGWALINIKAYKEEKAIKSIMKLPE